MEIGKSKSRKEHTKIPGEEIVYNNIITLIPYICIISFPSYCIIMLVWISSVGHQLMQQVLSHMSSKKITGFGRTGITNLSHNSIWGWVHQSYHEVARLINFLFLFYFSNVVSWMSRENSIKNMILYGPHKAASGNMKERSKKVRQ